MTLTERTFCTFTIRFIAALHYSHCPQETNLFSGEKKQTTAINLSPLSLFLRYIYALIYSTQSVQPRSVCFICKVRSQN